VLPGKKYTPEDAIRIAWRFKWAILVPFVAILTGTIVVSRFLPDKYRAETLILVVPQRVPEAYVRSTVTARIEDRLQSIGQEILSRTRLERIIHDFNLYAEERRTGIMQDIVERMRTQDIQVDIVKGDAFRVAYVGEDPRTVMQVTDRLASEFIDENLRDRELLAEGTNEFLEAQLEESRRRLIDQEKKLEEYRRKHAGQLPTQVDANLQVLQNTQLQIQGLLESINRDRDRKLAVERALADLSVPDGDSAPVTATAAVDGAPSAGSAVEQLDVAKRSLTSLELRLTPEHPDVMRMRRVVAELQQRVDAEVLDAPLSPVRPAVARTPAQMAKMNRIKELEGERDNLNRQIASKQAHEARLRGVITDYQARIEAVPTREAEMAELTRDYTTLQQLYATLLAKKEESKIAANLERRQIGEQFKVLDRARLPERPYSPNRRLLALLGALIGLGVGIACAGLLAYRDTTFRTEDDITGVLRLPVLARVPIMMTPTLSRRLRRMRVALTLGAVVACVAGAAGVVVMWKSGILERIF
jgi:polysaccharide chain length determinant protein (PEP-CTERM system associated)